MTKTTTEDGASSERTRICSQLQRQQERALQVLREAQAELGSPLTRTLLQRLASAGASEVVDCVRQVVLRLEDAIRTTEYSQSEIHRELQTTRGALETEGVSNLPQGLARFLAERKDTPGFTYEVRQDPVRGWIILWKEYAPLGTVRGSGQFYERPYAWLDQ
jgi:hypothetical protein